MSELQAQQSALHDTTTVNLARVPCVTGKFCLNNEFLYIVAIGNPERNMRKASHCGSKQQ